MARFTSDEQKNAAITRELPASYIISPPLSDYKHPLADGSARMLVMVLF